MNLGIATKASMVTRAADPVKVLAFGSRRAHGLIVLFKEIKQLLLVAAMDILI